MIDTNRLIETARQSIASQSYPGVLDDVAQVRAHDADGVTSGFLVLLLNSDGLDLIAPKIRSTTVSTPKSSASYALMQ